MRIESFDIDRHREFGSRSEQLNAASKVAHDSYRAEFLELRERQKRL